MLAFVAGQLGIPTTTFADYARRDQTRREHVGELHALLGLRSFRLSDWRDCLRVGTDAAWATDRGEPIVQTMLTHLRAQGVLVPDPAVLERIGLATRALARQLAAQLPDQVRDDPVVAAILPEGRVSRATVATIAYRAGLDEAGMLKPFDFSRATLADRWAAGGEAMRHAIAAVSELPSDHAGELTVIDA